MSLRGQRLRQLKTLCNYSNTYKNGCLFQDCNLCLCRNKKYVVELG
jgi:hypothetical protein